MGSADEQHPDAGGGDSSEGADLSVTLPSQQEQEEKIAEAEAEQASAFAISQQDIDAVLTRGSGFSQGKLRIYQQFLKKESSADNIAFLKKEYGIGGAYPAAILDGIELDASTDGKGLEIGKGRPMGSQVKLLMSWKKVEKRIGQLIDTDRYLNPAEKESYDRRKTEV